MQCNSAKQQQMMYSYLQEKLKQADAYQIHVEHYEKSPFLRFGDHGLKGGVKIAGVELDAGKTGAMALSAAQVCAGVYLSVKTSDNGKLIGGTLISSGFASGMYAYQQEAEEYDNKEYMKQCGYGATSGLVSGFASGFFGSLVGGTNLLAKICCKSIGSMFGNVASSTAIEVIESIENSKLLTCKKAPKRSLIQPVMEL
jgi:hypothetical protein